MSALSAFMSTGTAPMVCATSKQKMAPCLRQAAPTAAASCTVPITLLAWVITTSRVSGRRFFSISAGETKPSASQPTRVSSIRPRAAKASNGRETELCSNTVVITCGSGPPPALALRLAAAMVGPRKTPLMAMFRASVQLRVKATRSGEGPLTRRHNFRRTRSSMASAFLAIRWPLRPGLAASLAINLAIASATPGALGKLVAPLSR